MWKGLIIPLTASTLHDVSEISLLGAPTTSDMVNRHVGLLHRAGWWTHCGLGSHLHLEALPNSTILWDFATMNFCCIAWNSIPLRWDGLSLSNVYCIIYSKCYLKYAQSHCSKSECQNMRTESM